MIRHSRFRSFAVLLAALACAAEPQDRRPALVPTPPLALTATPTREVEPPFVYKTETFADLQILRYQVPGFADLDRRKKQLAYYLYEAGLAGHDIAYDQNYKHNLLIRRTLEGVWRSYSGDRTSPEYRAFELYTKRVWAARGIHHDFSTQKFLPEFSQDFFAQAVLSSDRNQLPLAAGETVEALIAKLRPILFDPAVDPKRVNRDQGADHVADSANNFYEGLTEREVTAFYRNKTKKNDPRPISHGLNSKLIKEQGRIVERVWKLGGMYSPALEKMVFWLDKARGVAENERQSQAISKLIKFYRTGDLRTWDDYSVAWVKDTDSVIDAIHGFIETFNDALDYRADFASFVSMKDPEASRRIATIAENAQWFEDHAPLLPEHKKRSVRGISARVITLIGVAGDPASNTPIGVNLPNANWIRKEHGSKSVMLGNIGDAHYQAMKESGVLDEFALSPEEAKLERSLGLHSQIMIDMHEVIGHASGQLNPGVMSPGETLKNYASTLEEARADLVALYYLLDPKLVELGLMPSLDVGKVAYNAYVRNSLILQLTRLELGSNVEQSHMRDQQMICRWVLERGAPDKVVEMTKRDGKTYVRINDHAKLRNLFGELLREVQRIKSSGDFAAGQALVETYGVKVDPDLHREVLARYSRLGIAPYSTFIQPKLTPIYEDGEIVDVTVSYPEDFSRQMLDYAERYSFLPTYN